MEEVWKDVVGFGGIYQVSNLGRLKRIPTRIVQKNGISRIVPEKIFHPALNRGYPMTMLRLGGKNKRVYVHRLVAEAFIPNPDNLPQVNHKDGNRANNNVDNLEWVTCSQNTKHSYDVLNHGHWAYQIICNETREMFNSVKEAAIHYNVAAPQLSNVLSGTGHCKTAKGLTFSFIERHYLRN